MDVSTNALSFKRAPINEDLTCTFHKWFLHKDTENIHILVCGFCGTLLIDRLNMEMGPIVDEDDWPKNWILEYIKPW